MEPGPLVHGAMEFKIDGAINPTQGCHQARKSGAMEPGPSVHGAIKPEPGGNPGGSVVQV